MAAVVYFSSASNNTARFVEHCAFEGAGIHTARIPLRAADEALHIDEPFVLICPTYGGGEAGKAVPVQVKRFLNDPANRQWIRGVIAAGNTNFGTAYAAAGPKCHVPLMYRFELMGTSADVRAVRKGLIEFFRTQPQDQP